MNALQHPWVGAILCVELETPERSEADSRPDSYAAFFMPEDHSGIPATAGVRGYKAGDGANNSAEALLLLAGSEVSSPRHQGGLGSHSGDGNADQKGFSMTATIPSALSISDLNTTVNHEPRILDLRIAERLGFANPLMIRKLIERNRTELETHGVLSTVEITSAAKGGRPGREFWLNEGQALVICMLSRTAAAAAIRKEVIEVYMAYRRGQLPPSPAPKPLSLREKRLLVAECRKINGLHAAQRMWRALDLPGVADQSSLQLSGQQDLRPGTGILFLSNAAVAFDMADTALKDGDRAVVVRNGLSRPQVPFVSPICLGRRYSGAADDPAFDGIAHLPPERWPGQSWVSREVRILGRVLSVEEAR